MYPTIIDPSAFAKFTASVVTVGYYAARADEGTALFGTLVKEA